MKFGFGELYKKVILLVRIICFEALERERERERERENII